MKAISKSKVYETILVMAIGFLLIFFITKWTWLLILDLGIVFFSLLYFPIAAFIAKYWMLFAEKLGAINSKIILSIIFFVFLTPIAFFYKIFNKKAVFKNSAWQKRENQFNESDFEKVW